MANNTRNEHKEWLAERLSTNIGDYLIYDWPHFYVNLPNEEFKSLLPSLKLIVNNCYSEFGIADYYLGGVCYSIGRYAEAANYFKKAINRFPKYGLAYYMLCLSYIANNNPKKAKNILPQISKYCKFALEIINEELNYCLGLSHPWRICIRDYDESRKKSLSKRNMNARNSSAFDEVINAACCWRYGFAWWRRNELQKAGDEFYASMQHFQKAKFHELSKSCSIIYKFIRIETELQNSVQSARNFEELRTAITKAYNHFQKMQKKINLEIFNAFIPIIIAKLAMIYILKELVNTRCIKYEMFRFIEKILIATKFLTPNSIKPLQEAASEIKKLRGASQYEKKYCSISKEKIYLEILPYFRTDRYHNSDILDDELEPDNDIMANIKTEIIEYSKCVENKMEKLTKEIKKIRIKKPGVIKEKGRNLNLIKQTYNIWTTNGKESATQKEVDNYRRKSLLFVDDDKGLAYTKGRLITALQKSPQSYNILVCMLEGRGSATPKNIFEKIYPDKKIKKLSEMKKRITTPIHRLENNLKNLGLGSVEFRGFRYYLEEEFDFVMTRKKSEDQSLTTNPLL
jgi:tetratricopeptide (TPR) repeat protein